MEPDLALPLPLKETVKVTLSPALTLAEEDVTVTVSPAALAGAAAASRIIMLIKKDRIFFMFFAPFISRLDTLRERKYTSANRSRLPR